jgi:hypothetical protein
MAVGDNDAFVVALSAGDTVFYRGQNVELAFHLISSAGTTRRPGSRSTT